MNSLTGAQEKGKTYCDGRDIGSGDTIDNLSAEIKEKLVEALRPPE